MGCMHARYIAAVISSALSVPTLASCGASDAGTDVSVPPAQSASSAVLATATPVGSLAKPNKDPADAAWEAGPRAICMPPFATNTQSTVPGSACGQYPGSWLQQSNRFSCRYCDWQHEAELSKSESQKRDAEACCYRGYAQVVEGRPLLDAEGRPIVPALVGVQTGLDALERQGADEPGGTEGSPRAHRDALALASMARFEHASVAEFARLSLALLRFGAPAALVRAAHEAARDEVRHATLALALARPLVTATLGPLDVARARPLPGSLLALALETLDDACINEALAAVELAHAAAREDLAPHVAEALSSVVRDEAEHAAFGYRLVAWALESLPDVDRAALEAAIEARLVAFEREPSGGAAGDADDDGAAAGATREASLLDERARGEALREGIGAVVVPSLRALAARSRGLYAERPLTITASTCSPTT